MVKVLPNQPKGLYLLAFAQMWEAFSYYGIRSILIIFMVRHLKYNDVTAFGTYAIYASLNEAVSIVGGYLADKVLGLRRAIYTGGIIMVAGHLCMSLFNQISFFYLGLGLIIVGSSLFGTNCTALLGTFYKKDDNRRDAGYTLFFIGTNIGSLLATFLCVQVGEYLGWYYAFSLASIGISLGLAALYYYRDVLGSAGLKRKKINKEAIFTIVAYICSAPILGIIIYNQHISINILPFFGLACLIYALLQLKGFTVVEKKKISLIFIATFLLAAFYAVEEQMGSTLILFIDRNVDKNIFGFDIPSASFTSINPAIVIIIGPLLSKIFTSYENKNKYFNPFYKIAFGFLLLTLSFFVLFSSTKFIGDNPLIDIKFVVMAFTFIACAELFVGPTVYALCAKFSPENVRGLMMGVVMLGFSFANLLSGRISEFMAVNDSTTDINPSISLEVYSKGFIRISEVCLLISILIIFNTNLINRIIKKRAKKYL